MKIGITELIVVFIVTLVVPGRDKLPVYAKNRRSAGIDLKVFASRDEAVSI
ncbi:MAG: twin-arginine translocase TatA/TatE family subunit [Lachnospiraceae bacterium]|nr:twin-arginine translocase TatA/TatE family subunit [Lachnospiraceae bacterium]MDD3795118.1 twin-arginine translocase TatA/TatE family subunit [Lachnospiraceae bacterium]